MQCQGWIRRRVPINFDDRASPHGWKGRQWHAASCFQTDVLDKQRASFFEIVPEAAAFATLA
jgi:hypothetical protein